MKILEINGVDFSSFINQRSYKMQAQKEYTSWVDGNRITRRAFLRERTTGSFNLTFLTPAELASFVSALTAATVADDYATLTAYVENKHELMEIEAFVTFSIKTLWTQDANQTPQSFGVTVSVQQR